MLIFKKIPIAWILQMNLNVVKVIASSNNYNKLIDEHAAFNKRKQKNEKLK